ncbi:MAG: lipopolysaccharide heptosyltransferase II [Candidatus Omnitrophica bacterium]|nr:lipopolysaccharide heptosyltransferase II [Candidatus Omnitrophota bacterium]
MALTVLQIVPSLTVGGVETGTVDLARSLLAKGHRAIVISSGGPLVEPLEAAGAIHYTLPVHRKNPFQFLPLADRVAEVVESHGVDILHARSRVPAMIGLLAWRKVAGQVSFRMGGRQRIPVFITTAHGYYAGHWFSRIMGWGRLVIAISERVARHMIDDFGVPADRIRLIPRGVDLSRFPYKEPRLEAPRGEWRVTTIGRITPIKGHRDLLRAFRIVVKSFPRARLSIVGRISPVEEKYFQELKALVRRLGLEDSVEFPGHESDVARLLTETDLAVLPSTGEEAFGRVLIEAGAAGVPVVATRVGGVTEVVVDRKTGLLVPPADPMSLGSAIVTLLKERSFARELARAGRRRVESIYPLQRMVEQTLDVYQEASERLRILVIKLSAVGDLVLITPSLRALRARFPKAHLSVLVGAQGRELLQRCPTIDELLIYDRNRDGSLGGLLRLGKKLRQHQVDLVVDFQNNRTSHWLGFLSGAPQRYGFAGRRWGRLLTHRVARVLEPIPPVEHQFRLLELLGVQGAPTHLELWPGSSDQERAGGILEEAWVADRQPLVVVHPGANPRWLSKRWPTQRYAQLVDELALKAKARVVLTGSAEERSLGDQIYREAKAKPIVAMGRTSLNELAALIQRADCFVGADTAPLHIAAAVGTPVVALFGSTDPVRHLPPAPRLKLLKVNLPCSPCYRRVCYRVGSGHMECMKLISVESVRDAVLSHLKVPVHAP